MRIREFVARQKRRADVHHDENVDAHGTRDIDGQILREAAIDQQAAIALDRGKNPGADRLARIALARSPSCITTGSPVSRSVATARKRVGNAVEVGDFGDRKRQPPQDLAELLALDKALGQLEMARCAARAES